MEALLYSFVLIAASEMGDKTMLLAFLLASRFRKPGAVMAGIFVATVLNHGLAVWVGGAVSNFVPETVMRYLLAALFIGFAFWILKPDEEEDLKAKSGQGAFLTTVVAFFLAEMGDKTQIATVALGAHYQQFLMVTLGSTLGMMFTNGLAVYFGDFVQQRISMKAIRIFSCILFILFGVIVLLGF